ncbi:MAG: ABC transporter ATP-binding protein [Anaerolineales bacterium]|nr:ABC transporter ATP-binding protein [Anaerolineales bacterium]
MGDSKEAMIVARDLTKTYSNGTDVCALDRVNIVIEKGEFVSVMGPSGSGKSTLLNLLGTLDMPTSGEIWIDGVDVSALSGNVLADFRRKNIGFIFQLFNLIPILSAWENVMLPLMPYRRSQPFRVQDRARDLLEAVGLGQRLDHLPGQLSGGEKQRVAIARALINEPSMILADEPTGNVDTKVGDEIMQLLEDLRKTRDQTVMVVTHNPRIAAYADRTYFLRDGAVVDESHLGDERPIRAFITAPGKV